MLQRKHAPPQELPEGSSQGDDAADNAADLPPSHDAAPPRLGTESSCGMEEMPQVAEAETPPQEAHEPLSLRKVLPLRQAAVPADC
jgi:hypothetical protein